MFKRTAMTTMAAAAVIGLTAAGPAQADSVANFYKGKNLTFLVGYSAGGSYGFYARLVAQHMSKYIPGKPNIIVQHRPGGGGSKAANYFYKKSPRDGSVLAFLADALPVAQLLRPKKMKYDGRQMTWIGSIVPVNPVIVVRKGAPENTVKGLLKNPINVGCSGRGSQSYIMPAMLKSVIGFKWKLICGYKGSAPQTLAMLRGEVDAQSSAWISWKIRHWDAIQSGKFKPVVQVGLRREKELPNIPLMQDLTDDPKAKQVLTFVSSGSPIGRSIVAPPDVPKERIAALRKAFDQVMQDSALRADAKKRNATIDPTPGAELQK
ncbi:MAG: Bug family tripartite tricarboxylate transporter substrate binding protein, partial [Rhodospirillales bacterium]